MFRELLNSMKEKPPVYQPGEGAFWNNEYISEQMLRAHLDPEGDAASRNHAFIKRSAHWIAGLCGAGSGRRILDLGCGPGLYAGCFHSEGLAVTGIDLSRRSVEYAQKCARNEGRTDSFYCRNYLEIEFEREFDAVSLIYCDLGVLSPADRMVLLRKIKAALKPGGFFVFDAWSPLYLKQLPERQSVEYADSGFWSPSPHLCIHRVFHYPETLNYLEQYVVITEKEWKRYHIWNQCYTPETLKKELSAAGFEEVLLFADVCGTPWDERSETICAVAR